MGGLVDEYRLLVHPVLAGSGKRPFGDGMGTSKLDFIKTDQLSLGGYGPLISRGPVAVGLAERTMLRRGYLHFARDYWPDRSVA